MWIINLEYFTSRSVKYLDYRFFYDSLSLIKDMINSVLERILDT